MHNMRLAQSLLVIATLAACGTSKETTTDTTKVAAAPAMAMAAAPKLADFAGTWSMSTTLTGVEKPVPSTMSVSADGAAWTVSLEGRPNVAVTASMSGDSVVAQTAEYESILRKGVMVSVRTASVLKDGAMAGNVVATYKTPKGEEKVTGTATGTRAPK